MIPRRLPASSMDGCTCSLVCLISSPASHVMYHTEPLVGAYFTARKHRPPPSSPHNIYSADRS